MIKLEVGVCDTGPYRPLTVIGCIYSVICNMKVGESIDLEMGYNLKGRKLNNLDVVSNVHKIGKRMGMRFSCRVMSNTYISIYRVHDFAVM